MLPHEAELLWLLIQTLVYLEQPKNTNTIVMIIFVNSLITLQPKCTCPSTAECLLSASSTCSWSVCISCNRCKKIVINVRDGNWPRLQLLCKDSETPLYRHSLNYGHLIIMDMCFIPRERKPLQGVHTFLSSSNSMTFHGFFHDLFKFSMTLGSVATFENFQSFPCFSIFFDHKQFKRNKLWSTKMRAVRTV